MQRSLTALLRRRGAIITLAAICSLLAGAAAWSSAVGLPEPPGASAKTLDPPTATHPTLRILWDQELLSDPSPAMDVRWASAHTVYVAWLHHGVSELTMDGSFTALRNLFPDAREGGVQSRYFPFHRLAASKDYVVAASLYRTLGFRPLNGTAGRVQMTKASVGIAVDLDLSENRLGLLGDPEMRVLPLGGGIAWLGPLSADPGKDLKPVLHDVGNGRFPNLINCYELQLGGVRFLPDQSFVVVPGSQPGAYLFSPAGHLLRTWDTTALGLDGDSGCAGMSMEHLQRLHVSETARYAYLNEHRVLDDILPLAQGPGLLIRSVVGGKVHWQLEVLQPAATLIYDVPLTGNTSYDRLRGDVRGDRIVLLRTANTDKPYQAGHLYVAELLPAVESGATPEGVRP
jgi:hypothetical protein